MFYRLLRLKTSQRREIERIATSKFRVALNNIYEDFFVVNTELNDYKQVMKLYKIDTPHKLFKALEDNPIPESTEIAAKIFLENFLKAQYRQKQNGI